MSVSMLTATEAHTCENIEHAGSLVDVHTAAEPSAAAEQRGASCAAGQQQGQRADADGRHPQAGQLVPAQQVVRAERAALLARPAAPEQAQ